MMEFWYSILIGKKSRLKMENKKALYAYFGELGIFDDNIPGHSFYQLGLLDSISNKYRIQSFDFYNYLDYGTTSRAKEILYFRPSFPDGLLGNIFVKYSDRLIDQYRISFTEMINNIIAVKYSKLFLKARFRNLATLEKKLTDAARFEKIITTALAAGYDPCDIVIVDTDLSMSEAFIAYIKAIGITREIPSITIPTVSSSFLDDCLDLHSQIEQKRENRIVYYGNLSFENYKQGHSKNPIIHDIISSVDSFATFTGYEFDMILMAKETEKLQASVDDTTHISLIPRTHRIAIWDALKASLISVNVSKDLYLETGFIPARVYESVIFGVIPVSFKKSQHPAMSFDTVEQFFEICTFLSECSVTDYFRILTSIGESLKTIPSTNK
jgi:hypothetical protein